MRSWEWNDYTQGWESRMDRLSHHRRPYSFIWDRIRGGLTAAHNHTVGLVYSPPDTVFDVVPFPTFEVTASPIKANIIRSAACGTHRTKQTIYTGLDGESLLQQPYFHRRRWTEDQWVAFYEFQADQAEALQAQFEDRNVHLTMIIKQHNASPDDGSQW